VYGVGGTVTIPERLVFVKYLNKRKYVRIFYLKSYALMAILKAKFTVHHLKKSVIVISNENYLKLGK